MIQVSGEGGQDRFFAVPEAGGGPDAAGTWAVGMSVVTPRPHSFEISGRFWVHVRRTLIRIIAQAFSLILRSLNPVPDTLYTCRICQISSFEVGTLAASASPSFPNQVCWASSTIGNRLRIIFPKKSAPGKPEPMTQPCPGRAKDFILTSAWANPQTFLEAMTSGLRAERTLWQCVLARPTVIPVSVHVMRDILSERYEVSGRSFLSRSNG